MSQPHVHDEHCNHNHPSIQFSGQDTNRGVLVNRVDSVQQTTIQQGLQPTMEGVQNIPKHHAMSNYLENYSENMQEQGDQGLDNDEFFFEGKDDFDIEQAKFEAKNWIEACTKERFASDDFKESLKDGSLLCKLLNLLIPNTIKKLHTMKTAFAYMENIGFFVNSLRTICKFEDTALFESLDLYEGRNIRAVLITIYWLGRYARGINWNGPHLNLFAFTRLRCTRCKKLITDDQYMATLHTQWHLSCGRCFNCNMDIKADDPWVYTQGHVYDPGCICDLCSLPFDGPGNFKVKDGKKLHPHCFDKTNCFLCKVNILGKKHFSVDDKNFCPLCVCNSCTVPLYEENGKNPAFDMNYCNSCVCFNCSQPHNGNFVLQNDGKEKWCKQCVCTNCSSALRPDREPFPFKLKNNFKFCPDCLCGRCDSTLNLKQATPFEGRNYCPVCTCPECSTPVHENDFKNTQGRNVHNECRCPACDAPFLGQQKVEKDGFDYHTFCICQECDTPKMPDQKLVTVQGTSFHESCCCPSCKLPFLGKEKKEFEGKNYHTWCLCPECKQPNLPGEKVRKIGDKTFHEKCLCPTCTEPFGDRVKNPIEGSNYHTECLCPECLKPNDAKLDLVDIGDRTFHKSCLCPTCHDPIKSIGDTPVTHKGKNYHPKCLCPECKLPVDESQPLIDIGDKTFHKQCVCSDCEKPFDGGEVFETPDGKLCPDCVCADPTCRKPLADGPVFEKDGKKFCPDCVCNKCTRLLEKEVPNSFIISNKRPYCRNCICTNCENPLINKLGYHVRHLEESIAKYCVNCICRRCDVLIKSPVEGENVFTYQKYKYCQSCVCFKCHDPLSEKAFLGHPLGEENPLIRHFCSNCLCAKCEKPVEEPAIRHKKKTYCKDCHCVSCHLPLWKTAYFFTEFGKVCPNCICVRCEVPLVGDTKFVNKKNKQGNKKYCMNCLCSVCQSPIINQDHMQDKEGHNACAKCVCKKCFVPLQKQEKDFCGKCRCSRCRNPLVGYGLVNRDENTFCHNCVCGRCETPLPANYNKEYCDTCYCNKCRNPLDYLDMTATCGTCIQREKERKPKKPPTSDRMLEFSKKGKKQGHGHNHHDHDHDHDHDHHDHDHHDNSGGQQIQNIQITPITVTPTKMQVTPQTNTGNKQPQNVPTTRVQTPPQTRTSQPSTSPQVRNNQPATCVTCHNELLPSSRFCNLCGTPVQTQQVASCPSCGESGVSGLFCHVCGFRLQGTTNNTPQVNVNTNTNPPTNVTQQQNAISNDCAGCGEELRGLDQRVKALNKMWHKKCFVCNVCGKGFSGNFFQKDGKPYCQKHLPM